jgi:phage-related protein
VLTEVKAYSSWRSAPTLLLDADGRVENDLIQIAGIEGLDPVKASVSTSPFGSIDGASHTGSSVLSRNIVLTLRMNPNWNTWTYEELRRLIYSYFMPKLLTRLEFYSDDMVPMQILGIVEDASINMFSKDPEIKVSIICPDPYFQAIDPTIYTGQNGSVRTFNYGGSIETGIVVKVTSVSGPDPTRIDIQIGDPKVTYFGVEATVTSDKYFELSSIPMRKYVQNIDLTTGVIENLLSNVYLQEGSLWPTLQPGENEFQIITDDGTQDYLLIFYERFGGL